MKIWVKGVLVTGLMAVLVSTGCADKTVPVTVDTIYFNGNVITVNSEELVAEAIAISDGKVLAVGGTKDIIAMATGKTRKINLDGKTMVPGFIDAHS